MNLTFEIEVPQGMVNASVTSRAMEGIKRLGSNFFSSFRRRINMSSHTDI